MRKVTISDDTNQNNNINNISKPVIISRNESEKVEIETSINSVRVNLAIKKYQENL